LLQAWHAGKQFLENDSRHGQWCVVGDQFSQCGDGRRGVRVSVVAAKYERQDRRIEYNHRFFRSAL
jgi:hypothetical protein